MTNNTKLILALLVLAICLGWLFGQPGGDVFGMAGGW